MRRQSPTQRCHRSAATAIDVGDVPHAPCVDGVGASGLPACCGRLWRMCYCHEKGHSAVTLQGWPRRWRRVTWWCAAVQIVANAAELGFAHAWCSCSRLRNPPNWWATRASGSVISAQTFSSIQLGSFMVVYLMATPRSRLLATLRADNLWLGSP